MPITKSASRAQRRSLRKTVRNRMRKQRLERALKPFRLEPSEAHRRAAQALIDKAAKWRIVTEARAARLTSRLFRSIPTSKG